MTAQSRRDWLDSLRPGDQVVVIVDVLPNQIASVTDRTSRAIIVDGGKFSTKTGRLIGDATSEYMAIEPVTESALARLEYARAWRDITSQLGGASIDVLHLIELALQWRTVPDVILAATERIREVTKERTEAKQWQMS